MALINCPHCGNKISDSAEKCVHCGKSAKGQGERKTDETVEQFALLSAERQKQLTTEFHTLFTDLAVRDKKRKNYNILRASIYVFLALAVTFILLYFFMEKMVVVVFACIFTAATFAALIAERIRRSYIDNIMLEYYKTFELWLKACKNINIVYSFNDNYKTRLNNTQVSERNKKIIAGHNYSVE